MYVSDTFFLVFDDNFIEKLHFRLKKAFYSACESKHFAILILKETTDRTSNFK